MPNSRYPRVVGFEVPPLKAAVDAQVDAPLVALLDIEPTANWAVVFEREVTALKGQLGLAQVTIEGDRILFYGSTADARELAAAVRALVDRVSAVRREERFIEAGIRPDAGEGGATDA